jgi:hypothetical protein
MDVALVERNVLDIQLVGGAPCLCPGESVIFGTSSGRKRDLLCKKFFGSLEQMVAWPRLTDDFRVLLNASYCA